MFKELNARKPVVGNTDYPTKINALIDDLKNAANLPGLPFSFNETTTAALVLGLFGGQLSVNGVLTTIADGTIALTGASTNYVEHTAAGVVSANTLGFSADKFPIAEVVTDAGSITGYTDRRNVNSMLMPGMLSLSVAGGAGTTVLTAAEWANDILHFTGALTGNRIIEVPAAVSRPKVIGNATTGAFSLTVKTNAGTGKAVTQGKRGAVFCDGTNVELAADDPAGVAQQPFAAGTRMLFQQTAAPTGWTKETSATYNDAALRMVTGAVGTGGADAFSTHFGTGKSTAGFTLTTSEMPAHTHQSAATYTLDGTYTQLRAADAGSGAGTKTGGSTGGGGSHAHTLNNFNIKYADCIIAAKD